MQRQGQGQRDNDRPRHTHRQKHFQDSQEFHEPQQINIKHHNPESLETKTPCQAACLIPNLRKQKLRRGACLTPSEMTTARAPETTRTKTHVISEGVRNNIMLFLGVRNNIGMGPENLNETAQKRSCYF